MKRDTRYYKLEQILVTIAVVIIFFITTGCYLAGSNEYQNASISVDLSQALPPISEITADDNYFVGVSMYEASDVSIKELDSSVSINLDIGATLFDLFYTVDASSSPILINGNEVEYFDGPGPYAGGSEKIESFLVSGVTAAQQYQLVVQLFFYDDSDGILAESDWAALSQPFNVIPSGTTDVEVEFTYDDSQYSQDAQLTLSMNSSSHFYLQTHPYLRVSLYRYASYQDIVTLNTGGRTLNYGGNSITVYYDIDTTNQVSFYDGNSDYIQKVPYDAGGVYPAIGPIVGIKPDDYIVIIEFLEEAPDGSIETNPTSSVIFAVDISANQPLTLYNGSNIYNFDSGDNEGTYSQGS